MSYPLYGNVYLGSVSGNIKLHVQSSGGNSTGIGYNNNSMTFGINQSALDTPKMLINQFGDVDVLGNVYTGGNLVVNSSTASTSATTGALQVAGGLGIVGSLNTGGNLVVNSSTASTSTTTGALQVTGGVGIVGNLNTGGNLVVNSTTASTSAITGALRVAGGVGIVGSLNTGGNLVVNSSTASTSAITGALQVAGGLGIVGNLNTGGNLVVNSTTASTSNTSGALQVAGGVGIVGSLNTGGNLVVNSSTASTSNTSGALQVAGGVGIAGNLNIGGFSRFAFDSSFNGNIQLTQATNPLWFVSKNTSTFNSTLNSTTDDVGIFYGTTNPAAAGLIISPRGIGGGIKLDMHGNVGIGKHPTEKLDVNGMVRSSDLRIDNGNIHLGQNAGLTSQGANCVAIGFSAGSSFQGIRSIAIGDYAGTLNQGKNSIAIGKNAIGTGGNSIAIGSGATTGIGGNSIAIGTGASTGIYGNSVAIGLNAIAGGDNQIMLGTANETVRIPGSFNLSGYGFTYIPWTAINNTSGAGANLTNVVSGVSGNPTASTNGSTNVRYFYSVVGKSLYIRFTYFTSGGIPLGTSGSGNYRYLLPAPYDTTGLSTSLVSNNTFNTGASRLGDMVLHNLASEFAPGSVYLGYSGAFYYMYLQSEYYIGNTSAWFTQNSSSAYRYSYTGVNIYNFEAMIPLA